MLTQLQSPLYIVMKITFHSIYLSNVCDRYKVDSFEEFLNEYIDKDSENQVYIEFQICNVIEIQTPVNVSQLNNSSILLYSAVL